MPREQDPRSIATRLIEARHECGATQTMLADAAGVHVATIRRIENGSNQPSVSTLARLAEALTLDVKDLLG